MSRAFIFSLIAVLLATIITTEGYTDEELENVNTLNAYLPAAFQTGASVSSYLDPSFTVIYNGQKDLIPWGGVWAAPNAYSQFRAAYKKRIASRNITADLSNDSTIRAVDGETIVVSFSETTETTTGDTYTVENVVVYTFSNTSSTIVKEEFFTDTFEVAKSACVSIQSFSCTYPPAPSGRSIGEFYPLESTASNSNKRQDLPPGNYTAYELANMNTLSAFFDALSSADLTTAGAQVSTSFYINYHGPSDVIPFAGKFQTGSTAVTNFGYTVIGTVGFTILFEDFEFTAVDNNTVMMIWTESAQVTTTRKPYTIRDSGIFVFNANSKIASMDIYSDSAKLSASFCSGTNKYSCKPYIAPTMTTQADDPTDGQEPSTASTWSLSGTLIISLLNAILLFV